MARELFYRIYVQGQAGGYDLSPHVDSFRIEESSGKADQLNLSISDPYKMITHAVQEGMQIEVDLGFADDHSIVFRGMIYKTEGDFPEDGVPKVTLLAYDHSMEMGLRKRNRVFTDMTLTDIVMAVAKDYFPIQNINIELLGEPTFPGNGIRQQSETDLAFLLRLAAAYGCEMFALAEENDSSLHFIAQHKIMTEQPQVILYHGRSGASQRLLRFQANASVSQIQLPRVFTGIDGTTGEFLEIETAEIAATAESEDQFRTENLTQFMDQEPPRTTAIKDLAGTSGAEQKTLQEKLGGVQIQVTPGFVSREDLRIRAQNQFSTSLYGMRGSGLTEGNHRLQAQTTIGIADVGGRFSNIWYLAEVRHILDRNGYRTEFDCQR